MARGRTSEIPAAWHSAAEKTPDDPVGPATSDVLAAVSHDLRNPLGTIILGSSLLLTQLREDPRAKRALEMIQRSANRMEVLLETLTDIASVESGQLELQLENVNVDELLRSVLADKATTYASDGAIVHCDRRRVGRMLEILAEGADTVHVNRNAGSVLFVIAESSPLRTVDRYVVRSIVSAHGGELWIEGSSVFFTLPEA